MGMEKKTRVDDLFPHPLLPEDFWIQILVWLPVISLIRFKSVCKYWRTLIESPFFVHLHTSTTTSSSSNFGTFIFQALEHSRNYLTNTSESKIFMLSDESGSGFESESDSESLEIPSCYKVDTLEIPSCYKFTQRIPDVYMVGSCNGLICIHKSKLREVSLWNPATRQFRILPKSLTIAEEKEGVVVVGKFIYDFVALGFDVKTNDYKVVQITCFRPIDRAHRQEQRVQVYSLSTDSWRLLEGINTLPAIPLPTGNTNQGLYLNGCYLFEGQECNVPAYYGQQIACTTNSILSFDFTKEIFTSMQFPDHDRLALLTHLGDNKQLALFTTLKLSSPAPAPAPASSGYDGYENFENWQLNDRHVTWFGGYENFDIWVLNEHRSGSVSVSKESWTKLHSFRIQNLEPGDWTIPRGISNNGKFALLENRCKTASNKKMQLFNLVTKEVVSSKDFILCDVVIRAEVYKPSLVSIIGGNGAAAAATDRVISG